MDIVIKILQLLASLSLLVIIHEFGHFLFAKIFKCRVEKFYLFFDAWFSLLKFRKGDTEYGIGWIPLGGYVKISGMVDESMDTEQLKEAPKPWEYRSKPAWQRLLIIIGGVTMNIILAMLIYIGLTFAYGDKYVQTDAANRDGFAFSTLAQEIGFRNGDKIISVDGEKIDNYMQIVPAILFSDNRDVEIERDGQRQVISVSSTNIEAILKDPTFLMLRMPFVVSQLAPGMGAETAGVLAGDSLIALNGVPVSYYDQVQETLPQHASDTINASFIRAGEAITLPVVISQEGKMGANIAIDIEKYYPVSTRQYGFFEAIPAGISRGASSIDNYLKQLKTIFSPETGAYKEVGGFITMGRIFPSEWNWYSFWSITALLSIMLAVLNILPIPALDGGHLVFILYEMITRRTPSQKVMEYAQMVGFVMVMALVLFANGNDILKLFR